MNNVSHFRGITVVLLIKEEGKLRWNYDARSLRIPSRWTRFSPRETTDLKPRALNDTPGGHFRNLSLVIDEI